MKIFKAILMLFLFLSFLQCGSPKIDSSTEESTEKSIQKIRESLPENKRSEFDEALQTLLFGQIDLADIMAENSDPKDLQDKFKKAIHGKTADEIISESNRVLEKRREKEKLQALQEIKELREKKANAEKAKQEMQNFQIIRSRYYIEKGTFMGKEPIIELTVRNNTPYAVSRAYFEGTVASPDRSVPWIKEEFNYMIRGGLEPGEEASWRLSPNMFSEWGTVEVPSDAILTVTVERLDGPDGEPVYSSLEFDEYDKQRLQELEKKYKN